MNTHWPQSIGACAPDGQHGMSLAICSVTAGGSASSAITCVEAPKDDFAITGPEIGASAKPTITRIAKSRRMVIWQFTPLNSHRLAQVGSLTRLTTP